MNAQTSDVLNRLREHLETENAWGPESEPGETARETSTAGAIEPLGAGGASNAEVVDDTADAYLDEIADTLIADGWTEGDAIDLIFLTIDQMITAGEIADLPEEDASDAEFAAWLGAAKTAGLHLKVGAEAQNY